MIKTGSVVFIPETGDFAEVTITTDKEMCTVQTIGGPSKISMWKNEKDLVLLFDDLPQGAPVMDIIGSNPMTVLTKITEFLWRKILTVKEENKKEVAELQQQVKDLQEKVGGMNQGLLTTQRHLSEHAGSYHAGGRIG